MSYIVWQAVVLGAVFTTLLFSGFAKSYVISDVSGHGRMFDGIGAISGGSVRILVFTSCVKVFIIITVTRSAWQGQT